MSRIELKESNINLEKQNINYNFKHKFFIKKINSRLDEIHSCNGVSISSTSGFFIGYRFTTVKTCRNLNENLTCNLDKYERKCNDLSSKGWFKIIKCDHKDFIEANTPVSRLYYDLTKYNNL